MRIAIIDDDSVFANYITKYIGELFCQKKLSGIIHTRTPENIMNYIDALIHYDVIFLDIEMPNISGINLAKEINERKDSEKAPYIIFVSGKDNLVFNALNTFPYSFVRKSHLEDIEGCLLNIFQKPFSSPQAYLIKTGRDAVTMDVKEIIYLEKQKNYIAFHTLDGIFCERTSIIEKTRDLKPLGFLRPNIGHLVNAVHIVSISGEKIVLSDGKELMVGRGYKKAFRTELSKWVISKESL